MSPCHAIRPETSSSCWTARGHFPGCMAVAEAAAGEPGAAALWSPSGPSLLQPGGLHDKRLVDSGAHRASRLHNARYPGKRQSGVRGWLRAQAVRVRSDACAQF